MKILLSRCMVVFLSYDWNKRKTSTLSNCLCIHKLSGKTSLFTGKGRMELLLWSSCFSRLHSTMSSRSLDAGLLLWSTIGVSLTPLGTNGDWTVGLVRWTPCTSSSSNRPTFSPLWQTSGQTKPELESRQMSSQSRAAKRMLLSHYLQSGISQEGNLDDHYLLPSCCHMQAAQSGASRKPHCSPGAACLSRLLRG
jgi:hypothetical protein